MTNHIKVYSFIHTLILFIALVLVPIQSATADSFRCNNKLVKVGDSSIQVKLKCGTPFDEDFIGQVYIKGRYVNVDRYTYVPGKGKFVKILEFHDGNLVSVTTGPRI